MNYREFLGVIVLDRVERMRIKRHDLLEFPGLECLNVLACNLFEEPFFAEPAYFVAGVGLVLTQDPEIRRSLAQDPCKRLGYFLNSRIERSTTVHEKQEVRGLAFFKFFHFYSIQIFGPG